MTKGPANWEDVAEPQSQPSAFSLYKQQEHMQAKVEDRWRKISLRLICFDELPSKLWADIVCGNPRMTSYGGGEL